MLQTGPLETLREVVRQGSFSAAASELSLTQPAVSRQISVLERQTGLQLVTRSRRGTRPTRAGEALVAHAEAILGRVSLAEAELAELAGVRRRQVRLGAFLTALAHLAPQLRARAEHARPELVIETEVVDRRTAMHALLADELDLAIVHEHEFAPEPPPPDIRIVALFDEPLRVILPAGHRLAGKRNLHVTDLARERWIQAQEGSAARLVEHLWASANVRPPVVQVGRGDDLLEAQGLVAAGLGIAISHSLGVWMSRSDVVVNRLIGGPRRRVQVALASAQHGRAALTVLELLQAIGADHQRHYAAQAGN